MRFKLIAAFVDPGITDKAISVAKKAGATGDVVIQATGSGIEESSFWGLTIKDKTNVILFVVEEHHTDRIVQAVSDACNLEEPGNGIMIVLAIDRVAGLSKQIAKIRERLNNEPL